MSNEALGARLAGELLDKSRYDGINEAETMLKGYLNVSNGIRF